MRKGEEGKGHSKVLREKRGVVKMHTKGRSVVVVVVVIVVWWWREIVMHGVVKQVAKLGSEHKAPFHFLGVRK
jgi:hypothetical protein